MEKENKKISNKLAYECLKWFENTTKTEEAFYLRFNIMPKQFKDNLMIFYETENEWKLFALICKFWNIEKSNRKKIAS